MKGRARLASIWAVDDEVLTQLAIPLLDGQTLAVIAKETGVGLDTAYQAPERTRQDSNL